jgi:hypothetical protein
VSRHSFDSPAGLPHTMASTQPRSSALIDSYTGPQTASAEVHPQNLADIEQPRHLSLDHLPVEIIQVIAQFVQSPDPDPVFRCFCEKQERRIRKRASFFDLSNGAPDSYSDRSWAFACVSKRFRDIVFHGNTSRNFSFEYRTCCIRRVRSMPESIRASVTCV